MDDMSDCLSHYVLVAGMLIPTSALANGRVSGRQPTQSQRGGARQSGEYCRNPAALQRSAAFFDRHGSNGRRIGTEDIGRDKNAEHAEKAEHDDDPPIEVPLR